MAFYPSGGVPTGYAAQYTCYDACPNDFVRELGPYDPFPYTPFYKEAESAKDGHVLRDSGEITSCMPPDMQGNNRFWWTVRATGYEQVGVVNPATGDVSYSAIDRQRVFSPMKVRLEMIDSRKGNTFLVVDIGSGFQASIGPVARVRARILQPDYDAYLEAGGDPTPHIANREAKSTVQIAASIAAPVHSELRYTQPLYFSAAQPTWTIPIPNFAHRLEALISPSLPGPTLVEYLRDAGGASYVLADDPEGLIPGEATHVRVTPAAAGLPTTITLVFDLRL